jgi:hypothetical protein
MKAKDRTNNPGPVSLKNEGLHKLCGVYNPTSRLVQKSVSLAVFLSKFVNPPPSLTPSSSTSAALARSRNKSILVIILTTLAARTNHVLARILSIHGLRATTSESKSSSEQFFPLTNQLTHHRSPHHQPQRQQRPSPAAPAQPYVARAYRSSRAQCC